MSFFLALFTTPKAPERNGLFSDPHVQQLLADIRLERWVNRLGAPIWRADD